MAAHAERARGNGGLPAVRPLTRASAPALLALATLLDTGCGVHTAPFRDASGGVLPGSIASMETHVIGGVEQSLWFRGEDVRDPALVLLHGGPGISESALFRHFDAELERHFLVVYWDQRGAGRSFHADIPPESMTIARLLADLDEVLRLVERRFGKRRVVLLGHSWGTVLGTIYAARHPERVAAYVGVAQIADMAQGDRLAWEFASAEAHRRGCDAALAELRAIGPRPRSVDEKLRLGTWVERFGGVFHAELSTGRLIWAALATEEANLADLVYFGRGNRFSLERLWDQYSRVRLRGRWVRFAVPVFFLLGRHDRHVPAELAAAYFTEIEAPRRRLVWFERSAHNPPFEEPEEFVRVLVEEVLPLAREEVSPRSIRYRRDGGDDAAPHAAQDARRGGGPGVRRHAGLQLPDQPQAPRRGAAGLRRRRVRLARRRQLSALRTRRPAA